MTIVAEHTKNSDGAKSVNKAGADSIIAQNLKLNFDQIWKTRRVQTVKYYLEKGLFTHARQELGFGHLTSEDTKHLRPMVAVRVRALLAAKIQGRQPVWPEHLV